MIKTIEGNEVLNRCVAQAVAGGTKPIELLYEPIYDGDVIAYRLNPYLNSLITGVMAPEDYMCAAVPEKLLCDFFFRVLGKAAQEIGVPAKGEHPPRLFTLRCPALPIYDAGLYARLRAALENVSDTARLCLEFYDDVMNADSETLTRAFKDIHAAGLYIAVDGYGGENFPIEKLFTVCPDYLFTDARVAALVADREKAGATAPLLNLAKSLGGRIIADAVPNDAVCREFRSRDVFGYLPAEDYSGNMCEKRKLLRLCDL